MLQDVADSVGVQRGVEGDRGVTRHPDGEIADNEVRAVLGNKGDIAAGRQLQGAQVGGHAAGLPHGFPPGVVHHLAIAGGLRQVNPVGVVALPLIGGIQHEFGRYIIHCLRFSTPRLSRRPVSAVGANIAEPPWKVSATRPGGTSQRRGPAAPASAAPVRRSPPAGAAGSPHCRWR